VKTQLYFVKTHLASIRCAPTAVLAFGLGGLIPFIGLMALSICVSGALQLFWLTALAQYGAIILSFVGALQWGYSVAGQVRGAYAWLRYGWSVMPALVGWLSLQFSISFGLRIQVVMLIVTVVIDRVFAASHGAPAWLMPLRYFLTTISAASLVVASYS
jgi:hypothetical protein